MSVLNQKTLKRPIKFRGIGLHTGKNVSMTIYPSEPNTGITFKRIDLKNNNVIVPNVYNVTNATLCTTVSNDYGVSVSTIEHLMGALYGLGVDNVLVEIVSQEVPIIDGSAKLELTNEYGNVDTFTGPKTVSKQVDNFGVIYHEVEEYEVYYLKLGDADAPDTEYEFLLDIL